MRRTTNLLLHLIGLIALIHGQNTTDGATAPSPLGTDINSTISSDCNIANYNCDGKGVCQEDGTCRCYYGYFPLDATEAFKFGSSAANCIVSARDIPTIGDLPMNQIRIFVGVMFGLLTVIILYRNILEYVCAISSHEVAAKQWVARFNMAIVAIYAIWMMVQCIDFVGMFGLMSIEGYYILFFFRDNIELVTFSSLLFHWAELYYESVRKLKKLEMIKKIKPDFEGNITMEDVLLKLSFASKFRFAYVGTCIVSALVFIGVMIMWFKSRVVSQWHSYMLFYFSYYAVVWILFSIGYAFYGFKLLSIIPYVLRGKIVSVMCLLAIYAFSSVAAHCIGLAVLISPFADLRAFYIVLISYALLWIGNFAGVNIFIPIWQWHRWFNPKLIHHMVTHGDTNTSASESKQEGDAEKSVSVEMDGQASV